MVVELHHAAGDFHQFSSVQKLLMIISFLAAFTTLFSAQMGWLV